MAGPSASIHAAPRRLAPEVWAGPVGDWTRLTHANDALKPLWGKTQYLRWKSDDFNVQGWLMYPVNYDGSKKYPLVVSVHGRTRGVEKSRAGRLRST